MKSTPQFSTKKYGALLCKVLPLKIRTSEEYERLVAEVEKLMAKEEEQLTPEEDRLLDLLADLITAYDTEHNPIEQKITPHQMLQYLMQQGEHRHKDIWPLFGSKSVASEVMNGNRAISKTHARKLGQFFKINPGVFI